MEKLSFEDYLLKLSSRMKRSGFSEFDRHLQGFQVDLSFHRREFVLAKFSVVDTFVMVTRALEGCTPTLFETFSQHVFQFALDHKSEWPRGLGGCAVSYPVLVVDASMEDIRLFVEAYCPKHWSSFEFPVLVDLSSQSVYHYTATPVLGLLYYQGFRKETRELFWPE